MGFLDKAMAQVQQAAKQGQDKLEDIQAKRGSDALLRDLGAWYYASETGRDNGQGPAEIARLIEAMPTVMAIKEEWPGARVAPTRTITADNYWWEHGDELPF